MGQYEYKVIPAPTKGVKGGDDRSPEGRFSYAVESALNEMSGDGWEYIRSDLLPSQERKGLTGSKTTYRTVLVFRRHLSVALKAQTPTIKAEKTVVAAPPPLSAKSAAVVTDATARPVQSISDAGAEPSKPAAVQPVTEAAAKPANARPLTAERKSAPSWLSTQHGGFLDDE